MPRSTAFWAGCRQAIPITVGYFPLAVAYGTLASQAGLSFGQTVLMSLWVYAGASQFMAVNMFVLQAAGLEIVLTAFLINLRHLVMSLSFNGKFCHLSRSLRCGLSLGLTDETFALLSFASPRGTDGFLLAGIMLTSYGAWVTGSATGALFAGFIPAEIAARMSVALYAMFIALLVPAVRNHIFPLATALASAFLCWFFYQLFSPGWAIVLATVLAALAGPIWGKETSSCP